MAAPKNPNTIIIQNSYYPKGLTEGKIYEYYMRNKESIIKEINGRFVLVFLVPKKNESVVLRNRGGNEILLNRLNYDEVISGRTISISVERGSQIDYFCVDIDGGKSVKEQQLKRAVDDVCRGPIQIVAPRRRVSSTASGYHVYLYLKKSMSIEAAHKTLKSLLQSTFGDKYNITGKPPKPNEIKLDISPTTNRGSHTVIGALCRNGLACKDVTNTISRFNRKQAIIS